MNESTDDQTSSRSRLPRVLISAILILCLAVAVFRVSPAYRVVRFTFYYGEAEAFVERVLVLRNEMLESEPHDLRALLDSPKFIDLKQCEMAIELNDPELVRFHVNDMFDIGLEKGGGILWHSN